MRDSETRIVKKYRFLREQNGPAELRLTEALCGFFNQRTGILHAYLAVVDFGEGTATSVALCLRATFDDGHAEIVNGVGEIFSKMFNRAQHLDIVFLTDEQQAQIHSVCRPFFARAKLQ
jgi:hypothetical protein